MIFDQPTKEEYRDIVAKYSFDEKLLSLENFDYTVHQSESDDNFYARNEIFTWHIHLANRMYQTRSSWVLMTYYFDKDIPDDEWYISPGRKGQSVEYLPHFEEEHRRIKAQFDYFSDVFFYKLFSAWDNLGHILNNMYDLGVKRADFRRAVVELKNVKPDLFDNLNNLIESDDFQNMLKIRHSLAHNELVGHVSSGMEKFSHGSVTGIKIGVGEYTTAKQVKDVADKSLPLFAQTIEFIKEQVFKDTP